MDYIKKAFFSTHFKSTTIASIEECMQKHLLNDQSAIWRCGNQENRHENL